MLKKEFYLALIISFLAFTSCSREVDSDLVGKTKSEVIEILGEPVSTTVLTKPSSQNKLEVLDYPNKVQLIVENGSIVSVDTIKIRENIK